MHLMKTTILARMVLGYLAIFVPVVAVSAYAISQLAHFHRVTSSILEIDNRMTTTRLSSMKK